MKKIAKNTIELIVPCYNEEKCIQIFCNKIDEVFSTVLQGYDYIITFVDDGSRDHTLNEIKKVCEKDQSNIQYISLSRNFGKEAAMYAGLSNSRGEYVAVLDVDLQHPPQLLAEMIQAIVYEGYDCATARRVKKKDPIIRGLFSKAFYRFISKVTVLDLSSGITDYRLMKRDVVDAIVAMPEHERFTKGIYSWVGFKNKTIDYEDVERVAGETTWNFRGLLRYAYSGFLAFATTPLRGVVYFGMVVVIFTIIAAIKVFVGAMQRPDTLGSGFTTIILLIMFFGGVIITILGMIGEYLARIYMEVKNRPIYFMRETNICKNEEQ